MNYGSIIRSARESLNMLQKDLATKNLSRNLISEIEVGKVKLVAGKAWVIYKQLIEAAWAQDTYLDLDFDDLLMDYPPYRLLREANGYCRVTYHMMEDSMFYDGRYMKEAIEFARTKDIGYVRLHILRYAAAVYLKHDLSDEALATYRDVLDIMKWMDMSLVHRYYKTCLKAATDLLYDRAQFEQLLTYTLALYRYMELSGQKIDPVWQFNIALYYQKIKDYKASNQYLKDYLRDQHLTNDDKVDGLILKSINHTELGEVEEGLATYEKIIHYLTNKASFQKSLALSNYIYGIVKHDIPGKEINLRNYIDMLRSMQKDGYKRAMGLFNLGMGYRYLNEHDQAVAFMKEGMEIAIEKHQWWEIVRMLREEGTFLIQEGQTREVVAYFSQIDSGALEKDQYIVYLELYVDLMKQTAMHKKLYDINLRR